MILNGAIMEYRIGELKTYHLYYEQMIAPMMGKRLGHITHVDDVAEKPALTPFINHGRWLIKCPFCAGGEPLYFDKLQFMCLSCFNRDADYKFLPVRLPRWGQKIEEILMKRPVSNRNWEAETVKELRKENRERGIR